MMPAPGFERRSPHGGYVQVVLNQQLKNQNSSGYPTRCLALWGQHGDWSARNLFSVISVTGWDSMFDLQLLSQCGSTYSCLSRSIPVKHNVLLGRTLFKQSITTIPPIPAAASFLSLRIDFYSQELMHIELESFIRISQDQGEDIVQGHGAKVPALPVPAVLFL